MGAVLTQLNRHRDVIFIDIALLAGLYLLPSLAHAAGIPLWKLEPMRIALIIAMLYTHRANAYLLALTVPMISFAVSGHPEPFKAVLMGIEFSVLVAAWDFLARAKGWTPFLALTAAILAGKVVYYTLKYLSLSAGFLDGNLVSTPVATQAILAVGTAAVFAAVEYGRRAKNTR